MALVHLWRRSSTASKSYLVHKRFHCRCLWNHLEQHLCAETRHKVANTSGAWVIGTHKFSKNTIHNEPELQDTAWWYEPAADISDFKDYCTYCTTYWIPPVPVVPTVWYGTIWLYDGRIALYYWIWPMNFQLGKVLGPIKNGRNEMTQAVLGSPGTGHIYPWCTIHFFNLNALSYEAKKHKLFDEFIRKKLGDSTTHFPNKLLPLNDYDPYADGEIRSTSCDSWRRSSRWEWITAIWNADNG